MNALRLAALITASASAAIYPDPHANQMGFGCSLAALILTYLPEIPDILGIPRK